MPHICFALFQALTKAKQPKSWPNKLFNLKRLKEDFSLSYIMPSLQGSRSWTIKSKSISFPTSPQLKTYTALGARVTDNGKNTFSFHSFSEL
ncbi:unnamed protein product [Haemonchus placei]|uniref:Ovule protein n=1 Tax=Haemonchus placei TaxID=6290 RepID=A0A0N4WZB0_HAEPC|nr:unnamed protein product [Haemonchus placei]